LKGAESNPLGEESAPFLFRKRRSGMSLKEMITVEVYGKAVMVTLKTSEDNIVILNDHVEMTLDMLKGAEVVKWYKNRIDFFFVMPQEDWQPAEIVVELKKLLKL
jgi:hypothetical protein